MSKLILSFDGGGIRGAASAQFLSHVENKLKSDHNKSIRDLVDFYAGTSTGSIIALALATTDLPVSEISELYNYDNARIIFTDNRGFLELDGINAPKYEATGKTKILKRSFGKARISDVPKDKHILAVAYSIEKRKPEVIKSTKPLHRNLRSFEVADASSAAPTYFPTKKVTIGEASEVLWLVDGGVTANNPTMCAIAEARKAWDDESFDDLRVLSVGTGYQTRKINGPESRNWGAIGWFAKGDILNVLSDERVVAYQAITIIKQGCYIRVDSDMSNQVLENPPDDAMDDISRGNIVKLKRMGDFWFERYGSSTIDLLLNRYTGPSLDRIDNATGKPIES
jgi:uncharacterized protein